MSLSKLLLACISALALSIILAVSLIFEGTSAIERPAEREARLTTQLLNPSMPGVHYRGNDSAKVTLVEFGDYQCTFCKRFHANVLDMLISDFVNTGKLKFLFKDFPINDIPPGNSSTLASEASYCAADQASYWQSRSIISELQRREYRMD